MGLVRGAWAWDDAGGRSFGILAPCVTSSSLCTDSLSTRISSSSLLSGSSTPRVDSMSDLVVSAPRVFLPVAKSSLQFGCFRRNLYLCEFIWAAVLLGRRLAISMFDDGPTWNRASKNCSCSSSVQYLDPRSAISAASAADFSAA